MVFVPRMALYITFLLAAGWGARADTSAAPLVAEPDQAAVGPNATANDPWATLDPAPVSTSRTPRPLARRHAPAVPASAEQSSDSVTTTHTWVRTTASLAGVIALILLLAWGYRRVAGAGTLGLAVRNRGANLMHVIGRIALSPRHSLCLVRIGPRLVLLGCTPTAVQPVDVITDADLTARLLGEAARGRADSSSAEFARCLERESKPYRDDEHGESPETATPDEPRLAALKSKLAGTLERLKAAKA